MTIARVCVERPTKFADWERINRSVGSGKASERICLQIAIPLPCVKRSE